jgi:hypothetical protein
MGDLIRMIQILASSLVDRVPRASFRALVKAISIVPIQLPIHKGHFGLKMTIFNRNENDI